MNNDKRIILILSLFTALGTAIYWILVFSGIFPATEVVVGSTSWFYSFPLADSWIVLSSVMLAISILRKNSNSSKTLFD